MIRVTYSSVDGAYNRREYKTPKGARLFAHGMIGKHPEIGCGYAISGDGIGKIKVIGMSLAELFPPPDHWIIAEPGAVLLRAGLKTAGVEITDDQLKTVLKHLDASGWGIWHDDDLDGG